MPTILYIEDDAGSQTLVQRTLAHAGYRVLVAGRGIEGIDLALREQPDLILMDINLPDLTGREITTRLRTDPRMVKTPIVALTAQSQAGEREKALVAGLTGYLTKPVDVDKLPEQVQHYLGGNSDDLGTDANKYQASQAYNRELVTRLEGKLREMEQNNADLRRMDKVKEDFIQLTAHELRTPMTVMYGYVQLLRVSEEMKRVGNSSPEAKMIIDGLVDSIERMSGVINEIVVISRIASGRVELTVGPTNMQKVMDKVTKTYEQAIGQRKIKLVYHSKDFPTLLQADADLISLALSNLLSNAIKFTPDGGTIRLRAKQNAHSLIISVQDTGIGIGKEDQKRIFDRFAIVGDTALHSTSKTAFRGGGIGLGLPICRGIVEAHGGRLWVESDGRDDKKYPGSSFFMDLPLQARPTAQRRL
jgi:signal transduction histidine kinase